MLLTAYQYGLLLVVYCKLEFVLGLGVRSFSADHFMFLANLCNIQEHISQHVLHSPTPTSGLVDPSLVSAPAPPIKIRFLNSRLI